MLTLQGLDRQRTTYPVVLKWGARRRFETELRALADVPPTTGLLPVTGGGIDGDGHPYLERALDGLPPLESLGDRMHRDGPLDVATAVTAVARGLHGLAALHDAGLVHGGVRPDVLVTGPPQGPVVADPVPPVVAERMGPLGPAFAAPEVLEGEPPTPAADVYGMAATLVHLVTGHAPWTDAGADPEQVLLAIMSSPLPDLGILAAHPGVAAAVVRALAGDPTTRPTAADLAGALRRGLDAPAGQVVSGTDRLDTVSPYGGHVPVAPTADDPTIPPLSPAAVLGAAVVPGGATPLGSRYLLHEAIGRGATGTVYRATYHARPGDAATDPWRAGAGATGAGDRAGAGTVAAGAGSGPGGVPTEVAVKVLREELADDPTVVARFLAERTTLVGLDHPNLVRVRDLVVEGSTMAIVMDLVDGPDLRRWMRTAPPLPPAAACRLLAQLAGALAAVHDVGIVHRDLKPENVLLARVGTAELQVRLTDFGVARSVRAAAARLTQHGQVVGTPAYLAPEVAASAPAGPPADVYALGVLAYELLAGCRPFPDEQPVALAHAHASLVPGRPPGLHDRLWPVLTSCLAKDPAGRPAARAVAATLLDVAATIGDDAPPLPRLDAPPPATPVDAPPVGEVLRPPSAAAAAAVGVLTPSAASATTPPGTSTPPHPDRAPDVRPAVDHPDDHLLTDVGTAPPLPRPPASKPGGARGRRHLYMWGAAAAVVALVAGTAIGLLTTERGSGDGETPAALTATPVYMPTTARREDPETVILTFELHPDANQYRVIRDPDDGDMGNGGDVPMRDVQIPEGASAVPLPDTANDQSHCYLVQALVLQPPSSTTTWNAPLSPIPSCPDGQPPSSSHG